MSYELMLVGALCFALGMSFEIILSNHYGVIDLDVRIENAILSENNRKIGEENELLKQELKDAIEHKY